MDRHLITEMDLRREFKAETGSYADEFSYQYRLWLENKYLDLRNKKQDLDFEELEGLEQ